MAYNRTMVNSSLESTLAALPPNLRREVADFADFLLEKYITSRDSTKAHPLASLAGAWQDEALSNEELLAKRTLGRHVEFE